MQEKRYYVYKVGKKFQIVYLDYNILLSGLDFLPKNKIKYDGISVNKMIIINPSMIEKILRRKIKKKLELYLKIIIKIIEDNDGTSDTTLHEALDDLSRYKSIIAHKYQKYLDSKYLTLLNKKISLLEYELNSKIMIKDKYEMETEKHRNR